MAAEQRPGRTANGLRITTPQRFYTSRSVDSGRESERNRFTAAFRMHALYAGELIASTICTGPFWLLHAHRLQNQTIGGCFSRCEIRQHNCAYPC